ncbi:MAG: CDP-diacylglycerol--serine O-phosphatidyltransferase [Ferrovum sp.]|nr:CDP-diacylglycerol--serine O-phosphatidyltransferase [Ferrovum sp.]
MSLDPSPSEPTNQRKGIYLLPNAFTTAALFAGFFAIVQGMNHQFELAAQAIFVAMVLDGLDGRVARLTHTQSTFGAEYDSLSDMVSFGVAPALVVYEWALKGLGKFGWLAAFIYCAGAALRLARFNTQLSVASKRWFVGLPSPSAAALIAGMVWVIQGSYRIDGSQIAWMAWCMTLFAGLSMVSNVPFYSFKDVNVRRSVPFWAALIILLLFVIVSLDHSRVLWTFFLGYAFSGYLGYLWKLAQHRKNPPKSPS